MVSIDGIIVTDKMIKAGHQFSSDAMDVHIQKAMDGMSKGKELDISTLDNADLIDENVNGDMAFVEAIFIAMTRASK